MTHPPAGVEFDRGLLLVAMNKAVQASRDTHSCLTEGIGSYSELRRHERAVWYEVWQAITDTPLEEEECDFLLSYPVPKGGTDPCPSE